MRVAGAGAVHEELYWCGLRLQPHLCLDWPAMCIATTISAHIFAAATLHHVRQRCFLRGWWLQDYHVA